MQVIGSRNDEVITLKSSLFSNVYLLMASKGFVMVDAGNHDQEKEILNQLTKIEIQPEEITLIIVTHGHSDHYGALAHLKEQTGADVLCHKDAAEYLQAGTSRAPVARTLWGSFIAAIHPEHQSEKVYPDILVETEFDLQNYGLNGKVLHTPGHTPDSLSIVLESGHILVGDMITGNAGNLSFGMFCEDEVTLKKSIRKILPYQADTIHLSHNESIGRQDLKDFIKTF